MTGPGRAARYCPAVPLPLVTERLVLRPFVPDDADEMRETLWGDPEVMALLDGPLDRAGVDRELQRLADHQDRHGFSFWAVVDRETGLLAGECGLFSLEGRGPEIELGYTFGRAWWGRGYATEAASATLAEAFGPIGLDRVVAVTRHENHRSQAVLGRLGFAAAGSRLAYGREQRFYELARHA